LAGPRPAVIAIAEESGLIAEIGAWVLRQACMAAVGWNGVAVHVNIATYQLAQTNLVDDIAAALSTTGLDPAMLVVEITESAVVRDVGQGQIQKLHVLGIQIGIDDFGMGYSSLARLRRVPAQILKIDKLFVENLVTSQEDRAILRAIHDLATAMGMEVVAEGVETTDQLAVLTKIGLTKAQGYYWSPAVPADEVPAMVARLAVHQLLTPQPHHEDAQLADGCSTNVRQNSVRRVSTGPMPGVVVDRARHVHPRLGLVVHYDGFPWLHSASVGTGRRTTDAGFAGLSCSGLSGHSETTSRKEPILNEDLAE
jgi:EAL domain-containing protein (putative c-di-GMP-specific phosphodiesterase class I)